MGLTLAVVDCVLEARHFVGSRSVPSASALESWLVCPTDVLYGAHAEVDCVL